MIRKKYLVLVFIVLFITCLGIYTVYKITFDTMHTNGSKNTTANWKTESNSLFSYKYPPTSNCESFVTETDKTSQSYTLGERVNTAGFNCALGSVGAAATPFLLSVSVSDSSEDRGPSYGEKQMSDNSLYKLTAKTTVAKSGISGTRWEYRSSDSTAAPIIYYYFKTDSLSYTITVNGSGSESLGFDALVVGEQIYQTWSLTN